MPLLLQQRVMQQDRAALQPASPPEAAAAATTSAAAMPKAAAAPRPNIVTSWARTTSGDASAAGIAPQDGQATKATAAAAAPWPAPSAAQLRKVCPLFALLSAYVLLSVCSVIPQHSDRDACSSDAVTGATRATSILPLSR